MLVRLVLALDDPALQRELRRLLGAPDVLVEAPPAAAHRWAEVSQQSADLFVISRAYLPNPVEQMLDAVLARPDAPAIIVISRGEHPAQHAELLAAGCQAVLQAEVAPATLAKALRKFIVQQRALAEQRALTWRLLEQPRLSDFVSHSPAMQRFMETVQRVVNGDVPLLLLGETGVGKERLAQAIHNEGPRRGGPFVAINCGALPETLLEAELFGHERGAFTGAAQARRGCFELAHGGTIFLDEVGDLPYHLQVKLLRVLQQREIKRLGAERSIKIDARIMAATNRELEREVDAKRFRGDLYYRLSVMALTVPPLRERREDIPELIENYIQYLRPRIGSGVYGITDEARLALCSYVWPGNIRELINVIERAMILCPREQITLAELPLGAPAAPAAAASGLFEEAPAAWLARPWREIRQQVLELAERAYLVAQLRATGGRVAEAAARAGMTARSLFEKMRHHDLRKEAYFVERQRSDD